MPATSGSAVLTLPSDTDILMVREFDAPPRLVYHASVTPELIKRWWGAGHGEVTIADVDLRVGGSWRFVMTAEGGFEVGFHGTYHEIVPNEKIVNTEIFEGAEEAGAALVTATFEAIDDGRRTRFSSLSRYPSKDVRDMVIGSGMETGAQSSYDALERVAIDLVSEQG